jgi:hypothetical protein
VKHAPNHHAAHFRKAEICSAGSRYPLAESAPGFYNGLLKIGPQLLIPPKKLKDEERGSGFAQFCMFGRNLCERNSV